MPGLPGTLSVSAGPTPFSRRLRGTDENSRGEEATENQERGPSARSPEQLGPDFTTRHPCFRCPGQVPPENPLQAPGKQAGAENAAPGRSGKGPRSWAKEEQEERTWDRLPARRPCVPRSHLPTTGWKFHHVRNAVTGDGTSLSQGREDKMMKGFGLVSGKRLRTSQPPTDTAAGTQSERSETPLGRRLSPHGLRGRGAREPRTQRPAGRWPPSPRSPGRAGRAER